MRPDVLSHIQAFVKKLENQQYEDLEIHLMHFHGVITEQEYSILSQRLVNKVIYSRIAKREGLSTSQVRKLTHGAVHKLITQIPEETDRIYQRIRLVI